MNRSEALDRLRAQVAASQPIIGAGAGTGLPAKCAQAGGADLIPSSPPVASGWQAAGRSPA